MRCPIKTPNENSLSIIAWSTNVKSKYKVACMYLYMPSIEIKLSLQCQPKDDPNVKLCTS